MGGKLLSAKEKLFAHEYLRDLNIARAARDAGYSVITADKLAHLWIGKDRSHRRFKLHLYNYIEKLKAERIERVDADADRVLKEVQALAFSDITQFVRFGTEKQRVTIEVDGEKTEVLGYAHVLELKNSEEIDGRLIREVTIKDGKLTFKLHDKGGPLRDLMRHMGLFEKDNEQKKDDLSKRVFVVPGFNSEQQKAGDADD